MKRILLISFVVLLILGFTAFLGMREFIGYSDINEKAAYIDEHLSLYYRYQEEIDPWLKFFSRSSYKKDAGKFLNHKILWRSSGKKKIFPKLKNLILSQSILTLFQRKAKSFPDIKPSELNDLRSQWMSSLQAFDYWNVDQNSPREKLIKEFYQPSFLPSIDTENLRTWVLIRLIQGKGELDPTQSMKDVLHLAKLVYSQEDFTLALNALKYLLSAKQMLETAPSLYKNVPRLIKDMSSKVLSKMLYTGYFQEMALLNPKVDHLTKKLTKFTSYGLCHQLNGTIYLMVSVHKLAPNAYKLMINRYLELFRLSLKQKICRLPYVKKILGNYRKNSKTFRFINEEGADAIHFSLEEINQRGNQPGRFIVAPGLHFTALQILKHTTSIKLLEGIACKIENCKDQKS